MALVGFNIDEFKSRFRGGALQNLFLFRINWPNNSNFGISTEDAQYLVRSTQLPDTTMEEVLVNWQGFDYKLPGKYTYSPFEVVFNVDVNANLHYAFTQWQKLIHDPKTNIKAEPAQFFADQVLYLLNYEGDPIITYKLVHAWPSVVGATTLDYATTDVAQFPVTFTYQYHEIFKGYSQ